MARELVEEFAAYAAGLLGRRLRGIIVYGSAARPQDFSPLSDVNVAVIGEGVGRRERLSLAVALGSRLFPIVMSLEELRRLMRTGHMLAHALARDSWIVMCDEEVERELAAEPPVNEETLQCLWRRSIACLSAAVRCYYQGLPESTTYAYRAVKSAAMYEGVRRGEGLKFSDAEVLELLADKPSPRRVLRGLVEARREGRGTSMSELDEAVAAVADLLRVAPAPWSEAAEEARKAGIRVLEGVRLNCAEGRMMWEVWGVDESGRRLTVRNCPPPTPHHT
ncbi:MAG: hypothetical protein DRJ67_06740 [Thermoprotei archaeon]|nr:MAG: hypothetical protein DRJ67_06740 [Thermoprotei archaeon]